MKDWLQAEKELIVMLDRDALILKKIKPPKLSSLAKRKPGVQPPMEDIESEVHQYRNEKK